MVHVADRDQFVHLRVVPTIDLDSNDEQAVVVADEALRKPSFRVSIGHSSNVMVMNFDEDITNATRLIDNLWVETGEEVWISTSHPNSFLAFGFTSKKVML